MKEIISTFLMLILSIIIFFVIIRQPQIKKVNYKRYDKPKGEKKRLTQTGYCYFFFYSMWSAKGFRIPFTLRIINEDQRGIKQ